MKKVSATVLLTCAFAGYAFAGDDATDLNAVFAIDTAEAVQAEVLSQEEMQSTEGAFLLHFLFGSLFHHHHSYSYYGHHNYQYNPCGC